MSSFPLENSQIIGSNFSEDIRSALDSFPISTKLFSIKDLVTKLHSINEIVCSNLEALIENNDLHAASHESIGKNYKEHFEYIQFFNQFTDKYKNIILEDVFLRHIESESFPDENFLSDLNISMLDNISASLKLKAILFETFLGNSLTPFWKATLELGIMLPEWILKFAYSIIIELSMHMSNPEKDLIIIKKCCSVIRNIAKTFSSAAKNSNGSSLKLDYNQNFILSVNRAYDHIKNMPKINELNHIMGLEELIEPLCEILLGSLQILLSTFSHLRIGEKDVSPIYCINTILSFLGTTHGLSSIAWTAISSIFNNFSDQLQNNWTLGNPSIFLKGYLEKVHEIITYYNLELTNFQREIHSDSIQNYVLLFKEILKCISCFTLCSKFSRFTRLYESLLCSIFVDFGHILYTIQESIYLLKSNNEICDIIRQFYSRLDSEMRGCFLQHLKKLYFEDSSKCIKIFKLATEIPDKLNQTHFKLIASKLFVSSMMINTFLPEIEEHDSITLKFLISEILNSILKLIGTIQPTWFSISIPLISEIIIEPTILDIVSSDIILFISKTMERCSEHELESLVNILWENVLEADAIQSLICCKSIAHCTSQLIDFDAAFVFHVLDMISFILIKNGHNLYSVLPENQNISSGYLISKNNISIRIGLLLNELTPILKDRHFKYLIQNLQFPSIDSLSFDIINCSYILAQIPQSTARKVLLEPDINCNFSLTYSIWESLINFIPQLIEDITKKNNTLELPLLESFIKSTNCLLDATNDHIWKNSHNDIIQIYIQKKSRFSNSQNSGNDNTDPFVSLQYFVDSLRSIISFQFFKQIGTDCFHLERVQDAALQVFSKILKLQQHVTYFKQPLIRTDQFIQIIKTLKGYFESKPYMRPMISTFIKNIADAKLTSITNSNVIFLEISAILRMMVSPPRITTHSVIDIAIIAILSQNQHHFFRDFVYFSKNSGMPDELLKDAMPSLTSDRQKVIMTIKFGSFKNNDPIETLNENSMLQNEVLSIKNARFNQLIQENLLIRMSMSECEALQKLSPNDSELFGELYKDTEKSLTNSVLLMQRLINETPSQLNTHRLEVMSSTILKLLSELRNKQWKR